MIEACDYGQFLRIHPHIAMDRIDADECDKPHQNVLIEPDLRSIDIEPLKRLLRCEGRRTPKTSDEVVVLVYDPEDTQSSRGGAGLSMCRQDVAVIGVFRMVMLNEP